MELPFMEGAVTPQQTPPTKLVLTSTRLEVGKMTEDMVFLRFIPEGLGFTIEVPWPLNDFRMMVNGWLRNLATGSDNGVPSTPEG